MLNLYYINSRNQKIEFNNKPYILQNDSTLFNHEWQYTQNDYIAKIDSYSNDFAEREFAVAILSGNKKEYAEALDYLTKVTDYDVRKGATGKLYVGDYYLRCAIVASTQGNTQNEIPVCKKTFRVVAETGNWINETKYSYTTGNEEREEGEGKEYPFDYAYDLASSTITKKAKNDGVADADFRMTIYGSCSNPTVYINGWEYTVYTDLLTGEYLTIDTLEKTIIKTKNTGERENCFHLRDKDSYIFHQIEQGEATVVRDDSFGVDLVVYSYRSEPVWWT